ncbi:MAG: prolipoprotein diacylglyceryl transferase [Methylococcales bacterium]|nr:prolipoprotein diacylglyceryl transferase [Methylococcales bacterium]
MMLMIYFGILIGLYLFQLRVEEKFVWFIDRISVVCALGACFIRTGNFLNSEIVGIPTTAPWAVVFTRIDSLPRHPVQLYEVISYFFVFVLLLHMYRKMQDGIRPGAIFATFLVIVLIARFFLEFLKTKQEVYESDFWLLTGQMLSIPFILTGILFISYPAFKKMFSTKLEIRSLL